MARLALLLLAALVNAQSQAPPVPPLQWINLSTLAQGTARPPPLRDAAIGYDDDSRSLIIFGGLAQSGLPQSQTYLLNLDTLTWSVPGPPPTLQGSPPSRSAATYGVDFAASNRRGFIVIGGRGADGKPLSDIWEYDFINQFWAQVVVSPGGPTPRWGASGGIDIRTPFVSDPVVSGPNNTFYLAGGFDGTNPRSLSEVWRLSVSGTLASNLPDAVRGSWDSLSVGDDLPGRIDQGGTIVGQTIIAAGGCAAGSNLTDPSCAVQDTFIINVSDDSAITPSPCPAPRVAPLLLPNLNTFSPSFASQALLLLGTFNTTQWSDSNGLSRGEVAILDINTGAWARVLPSGDPTSQPPFPSPRQGAVGVNFGQSLVGTDRTLSSDTIIFGGQDANGNMLSDLWLLRAYNGFLSPTNPTWPGFGNGQLGTGINANGAGVNVTYIQDCATLNPNTDPPSHNGSTPNPGHGNGNNGNGGNNSGSSKPQFDTAKMHKVLSPVSFLAALLPLLYFTLRPSDSSASHHRLLSILGGSLAAASYGLGVAGLIIAFTSITSSTSSRHLRTTHGVVGLVFAVCFYALLPAVYLVSRFVSRQSRTGRRTGSEGSESPDRPHTPPPPAEKLDQYHPPSSSSPPSVQDISPPASPRQRSSSLDVFTALRRSSEGNLSEGSTPPPSSTPKKSGFEVLNRPKGRRVSDAVTPSQPSQTGTATGTGTPSGTGPRFHATRALSEIDWLLRRRSLNAVGELDYVLTQAHNAQVMAMNSNPATPLEFGSTHNPLSVPKPHVLFAYALMHISILGLSSLSLAILWTRAPRYLFGILLIAVIAFYVVLFVVGWNQSPSSSFTALLLWKLRRNEIPRNSDSVQPLTTLTTSAAGLPMSEHHNHHNGNVPYMHPPPVHRSPPVSPGFAGGFGGSGSRRPSSAMFPHGMSRPMSTATDDADDDIDEDTRQRLIEEEMERRDVSIITVPRRKLKIANPE